jgi:hypothetical protein
MARDDRPGESSPVDASPVDATPLPAVVFLVVIFAVPCAILCAVVWAIPRPEETPVSFLLGLVLYSFVFWIPLLIGLVRNGNIRWALPFLPPALVGAVPRVIGLATGSWAGGSPLGVAGAAVGAVAGAAAACVFLWWVMPVLKRNSKITR